MDFFTQQTIRACSSKYVAVRHRPELWPTLTSPDRRLEMKGATRQADDSRRVLVVDKSRIDSTHVFFSPFPVQTSLYAPDPILWG